MKLTELMSSLVDLGMLRTPRSTEVASRTVSSICFDSRKLQPDCIFVAIRGEKADGHRFLNEAIENGAIGLVVEDDSSIPATYEGAVAVVVNGAAAKAPLATQGSSTQGSSTQGSSTQGSSTHETPPACAREGRNCSREALNRLASRFFGEPSKKLFCVGVTGTNGKTTVTYMTEAILNAASLPTGVIGTINHHLGDRVWPTEMTTPDPISFQQRLSEFLQYGAKAVALEVSSHALHQSRVDEVPFDVAIFTNLSRDHLDYHSDMEDYFRAKSKLFSDLLSRSAKPRRLAVVNGDDPYGQRLTTSGGAEIWTYGENPNAHLRFKVLAQGFGGTKFLLKTPECEQEFHIRMPGLHNVYNACGAIGAGLAAGIPIEDCAKTLAQLTGVKGRLEAVPNKKGVHVFVDYAHTDGAIETVLLYLNMIRTQAHIENRIITVFGCGGDRDKGKRPLMMKAALNGSDLVVLTSDNPRTEDPEKILDDAANGADPALLGTKVFREVDRRKGIAKAIELARPGDVVLVAGKGHEDYQQIGTQKFPFSDVEVVKEILK